MGTMDKRIEPEMQTTRTKPVRRRSRNTNRGHDRKQKGYVSGRVHRRNEGREREARIYNCRIRVVVARRENVGME